MERSLVLIKPKAMRRNLAGAILARFEQKGLKTVGLKMLHMDEALAKRHYAVHEGKPSFNDLVKYSLSTPIVAIVFQGSTILMGRDPEDNGRHRPEKSGKGHHTGRISDSISRITRRTARIRRKMQPKK